METTEARGRNAGLGRARTGMHCTKTHDRTDNNHGEAGTFSGSKAISNPNHKTLPCDYHMYIFNMTELL